MSARLVAAICLFVSFSAVVPAAAAAVEPTATWSGKVKDRSLLELAPSSGFIAGVKIWEKLWKAWRPDDPVPKVDFAKELIIVATVLGPNRVIMVPGIDDEGNLVFAAAGTKMFGPGFGYTLLKIGREGVKTVNGTAVPAAQSADGNPDEPSASPLAAEVGRENSRVQFFATGEKTIVDITSEFGIDKGTVRRTSSTWPKEMTVRLHLRGLERFLVGNGETSVAWSVASTGNHQSTVSLRSGTEETPLDKRSPYYTEVQIVGGNGSFPLKTGYFEVALPAKLLASNPEQITLQWIDFYRN